MNQFKDDVKLKDDVKRRPHDGHARCEVKQPPARVHRESTVDGKGAARAVGMAAKTMECMQ